ncbi:MAG TPA: hypothetical protein VM307_01365 [Egibacteraceae bacterium]|nr:hypothetical protein [Egibacteraceae bacterium]
MTVDRDRTAIRRALRSGLILAVLLAGFVALAGAPGAAIVMTAVAVLAFVVAGWLMLSVIADLLGGQRPGRRRILWTVGAMVVAMLAPFLVVGTLVQRAQGGGG